MARSDQLGLTDEFIPSGFRSIFLIAKTERADKRPERLGVDAIGSGDDPSSVQGDRTRLGDGNHRLQIGRD